VPGLHCGSIIALSLPCVSGLGQVYLVRHIAEGKSYVLKVIKLKGMPAKEKEACHSEVLLMKRLKHPNIVAYKDSFFANGKDHLCIVMTYCDGGDLTARVAAAKGQLLKEDQIMHWFVQIALAMHYMHENNVLHRDIKSQSEFISSRQCNVLTCTLALSTFHRFASYVGLASFRSLHQIADIFLLGNGRLVLGDLGISKVLDGTMAFASTQIGEL
jgi:serine/threonine protein kinase